MRENGKIFLTMKHQFINVEEMLQLESHHFATITVIMISQKPSVDNKTSR